ncbi:glycoside hydrolase [Coraliomargarita sinensis]|uniref:beta-N-acetylhexosaminidase n=1 Tax=Coraliomargarita sinensis TaxID=2174842 RepID=A0A317ZFZ6_9BACT|nr:family 20 glycosylhydrolase [Coraliomargarita sinensis]PXA04544.1 glycoside hydrolase [Coraliomargarita sinensis]
MDFLFPPRTFERLEGNCVWGAHERELVGNSDIPAQGYRLRVQTDVIHLEASDKMGLFYGRQLLGELKEQHPDGELPCCRIEDWPDFKNRGYMLDISRDRVPTMEHLFHLVDQLVRLRYNQLQLYTEHTFAYKEHKTVWAHASPMTASEIRELDQYCRDRHIELVPNQNSFGHMERWLAHDAYRHLAECPEGFRHPISGAWRPQGSVIKPDAQSLEFLDGLYRELLPNFSSRKFNIGGDEPWELGWGASADAVKAQGKHKVYADFLGRVCELATEHGSEPMCWSDVLLEEPSFIERLPESVCPVIWGYEVGHPFEQQCTVLAELGHNFYVAPGDSTWTSYTGRLPTMLTNVQSAARIGKKYGAAGLLMTHWGDNGHPQTWPVSLPGLVWAGLQSWNGQIGEESLEKNLRHILGDQDGAFVETLLESGKVDERLGVHLVNKSFLADANLMTSAERDRLKLQPEASALRRFKRDCETWLESLTSTELDARDAAQLVEELELVLRLNLFAVSRCLKESEVAPEALRESYARCWHSRSRPGGLGDSLEKIFGFTH